MILTYLDAGVLIEGSRGTPGGNARALAVLSDPDREFAASLFLRLEILPKPVYYGKTAEAQFYERYFAGVSQWAMDHAQILALAFQEAAASGLAALDALHIAAAVSVGAAEFVTTERPGKPMYRVQSIRVVSLDSLPFP